MSNSNVTEKSVFEESWPLPAYTTKDIADLVESIDSKAVCIMFNDFVMVFITLDETEYTYTISLMSGEAHITDWDARA